MNTPHTPISRRTAVEAGTALAAGMLLGAFALPSPADAAVRLRRPWRATLTPTQQVGQRVIFSYPGPTPPDSLLAQIEAGEVGGVIFFGENIESPTQIAAVVEQLKWAHYAGPVTSPMLFMTDQEGGLVRRLRGQPPLLSEKQIGLSTPALPQASAAGDGAGHALAAVGMNLNLAPVLDVFREPGDFDDEFGRSYSSDLQVAGALGSAFVTAQQATGIAATAKHFPGLGAATRSQNTDLTPVTLDRSLAELRSVDEAAFVPSILAGVKLVMTSWAVYPAIDPAQPAGLSTSIVQGELRNRLHFEGVTITDALEAGALTAFGDVGQRAVLAALAGMDLLLCAGRDVAEGQAAVTALAQALQAQTLNPDHFLGALRRVRGLREGLGVGRVGPS